MDNVTPEVLMNAILGKISDVLLNGDGNVIPQSDDHYLAFMSPGIPLLEDSFDYAIEGFGGVARRNVEIDKLDQSMGPQGNGGSDTIDPGALAADARRKYQAAEAFFAMCDLVPDTSGIVDSGRINTWQPETRVSHAYTLALQFSQVIDVETDEETKLKLERWRSLLQTTKVKPDVVNPEELVEVLEESELVKKYREKMLAYITEALAYNSLRISALAGQDESAVHSFTINAQLMQAKVRAAMNDWISNGFKDEYERLNAAIAAVEGRSFALLKQRYKEDFFRGTLTNPTSGANFQYTAPVPADFARAGSGWSEFYFNHGSFRSNHSYTSSNSAIRGGFAIGSALFGGAGGVTKKKWEGHFNVEKFELKFEMARIPIYRPGFNLAFLKSGYWRFDDNNPEYKNTLLSDGASPPNGLMPALTTDCIFIRNLKFAFGENSTDFSREKSNTSGRAGFSWGPIFLGGGHGASSDEREFEADWSSQGVEIKGMQLLGFLCHTLDKAPNPHPDIDEWI